MDTPTLSIVDIASRRPPQISTIDQLREKLRPTDAVDVINEVVIELRRVTEDFPMSRDVLAAKKILLDTAFRTLAATVSTPKSAEIAPTSRVNFVLNLGGPSGSPEREVISTEGVDE